MIPTRHARHGMLFTSQGGLAIRNARFARDDEPLDRACECPACGAHSRASLRHLFQVNDALGPRLATLHNLRFYLRLLERFYDFRERYHQAREGITTGDVVVDSFAHLAAEKKFEEKWIQAFLQSMEMDITKTQYQDMDELLTYLYGSSEVVGLFMARIMDLSADSYPAARYLGRAMQYINFIRDIDEDLDLGRVYFPQDDLEKFGLNNLQPEEARKNPEGFRSFVHKQLDTYLDWQAKAEAGFKYIPYRYLIPVKTASDLYKWTGSQIRKDPLLVYQRKVKPSLPQIVTNIFNTGSSLGAIWISSGETIWAPGFWCKPSAGTTHVG